MPRQGEKCARPALDIPEKKRDGLDTPCTMARPARRSCGHDRRLCSCPARAEDVEHGGRYDARAAAINVWSHSWINEATRHDSETIGTFYFWWGDKNHLWLMQCDAGYSLQDLLIELGLLEIKALGRKVHGW